VERLSIVPFYGEGIGHNVDPSQAPLFGYGTNPYKGNIERYSGHNVSVHGVFFQVSSVYRGVVVDDVGNKRLGPCFYFDSVFFFGFVLDTVEKTFLYTILFLNSFFFGG